MGNTNSSQVYDPVHAQQPTGMRSQLHPASVPIEDGKVCAEADMSDLEDADIDNESCSSEHFENRRIMESPSEHGIEAKYPDSDLYNHSAVATDIEMDDSLPDASDSFDELSTTAEDEEDVDMEEASGTYSINDQGTKLRYGPEEESWHDLVFDNGLRGHSTPVDSPTPPSSADLRRSKSSSIIASPASSSMKASRQSSAAPLPDQRESAREDRVSESPTRSPPFIEEPTSPHKVSHLRAGPLRQHRVKVESRMGEPDNVPAITTTNNSSLIVIRARYAKYPDPEKDVSRLLKHYRRIHKKADEARPRQKLAQHRYCIAVIPLVDQFRPNASKLFFFLGNRKTTVETVRRHYAVATASADADLLLGQERVKDTEVMEELDIFNTKLIVFQCVLSAELASLAKKHSDGLVLPEDCNPPGVKAKPIVIDD